MTQRILLLLLFAIPSFGTNEPDSVVRDVFFEYKQTNEDYLGSINDVIDIEFALRRLENTREFERSLSRLEKNLKKSVRETAKYIDKFIADNKDKVLIDDDLLLRIVKIQFELANYDFENKMRVYQKKLSAYYGGRLKNSPQVPYPDYKNVEKYASELLNKYPSSSLADHASYLKAYLAEEQGDFELAKARYKKFISKYPYSSYKPEIHFRLAEIYNDEVNLKQSLKNYQVVLDLKDKKLRNKALYKKSAILYQLKNYRESLKGFQVLYSEIKDIKSEDRSVLVLKKELNEYFGLFIIKGLNIKVDGKTKLAAIKSVADRLERHQEFDWARDVYRLYIKNNPTDREIPLIYKALIESLEKDGDYLQAGKERTRMISSINKRSRWYKNNISDFQTILESEMILEKANLEIARVKAEKAIADGNSKSFRSAIQSYRLFVRNFPNSEQIFLAQFELGQLLYKQRSYKAARKALGAALDRSLGEDLDLAAYAYFLASEKALKIKLPSLINLKPNSSADAIEIKISDKEKSLISSSNIFFQFSADIDNINSVRLFLGQMYIGSGDLGAAEFQLAKVITSASDSGLKSIANIRNAANFLTEIYSSQERWNEIKKLSARIKGINERNDIDIDIDPMSKVASKSIADANRLSAEGKDLDAAENYLTFAIQNPKSQFAKLSRVQAGIHFRKALRFKKSNQSIFPLVGSKYDEQANLIIVQNLIDSLQVNSASKKLTSLVKKYPKNQDFKGLKLLLDSVRNRKIAIAQTLKTTGLKTNKESQIFEAIETLIDSGNLKLAKKEIKSLKSKTKLGDLTKRSYQIQIEFLEARSDLPNRCIDFKKLYDSFQKVNLSSKESSDLCDFVLGSNNTDLKGFNLVSKDWTQRTKYIGVIWLSKSSKNVDQLIYSFYRDMSPSSHFLDQFAVLNNKLPSPVIRSFRLSPTEFALSESIPWRDLFYKSKLYSPETECELKSYIRCYKKMKSIYSKTKSVDASLMLAKVSLILNNDKLAKRWVEISKSKKTLSPQDKSGLDSIYKEQSVIQLVNQIYDFGGNPALYSRVAEYYIRNNNERRARFAISTGYRKNQSSIGLQALNSFMDGSKEGLFADYDDRQRFVIQFLDKSSEIKPKTRAWRKSLSLLQGIVSDKTIEPKKISKSIYSNRILAHYYFVKGDKERSENKRQIIQSYLPEKPDEKRGLANE
ncbi:MAG: tetratricopeptide repeat protein [Bdellovibrionales bacterium]